METTEPSVTLSGLSNHSSSSSPENSDDFVLVPNNLPTDQGIVNYERKLVYFSKSTKKFVNNVFTIDSKYSRPIVSTPNAQASPPRPSSLPISEPKPIPTAGARRFSRPQTPPKVIFFFFFINKNKYILFFVDSIKCHSTITTDQYETFRAQK